MPCYHDNMIVTFKDRGTEDIFNGVNTKAARKACPQTLWKIARRKLDQLDSVGPVEELRQPVGGTKEALIKSAPLQGRWSTRLGVYEFPATGVRSAAFFRTYSPKAVLHSVARY